MNISGPNRRQGTQAENTESASSSSVTNPPLQRDEGRRLRRQDALPTDIRYNANQTAASPQNARAAGRYESEASSSGADDTPQAEGSMPSSSALLQFRLPGGRNHSELENFHTMMLNSPKASRGDAIPEKPEAIPKRLLEKMEPINLAQLALRDKDLHEYAVMVCNQVKKGEGPNADITQGDIKLLPLFAKVENTRNPGLNLHTFKSHKDCYKAIKEQNKDVQRNKQSVSIRVVYPPFKVMPDHHIALDIQLRYGHRPSIVGFESAPGNIIDAAEREILSALGNVKLKMVGNFLQYSKTDCTMFALNNALKAFKHHEEYTSRLHNGEKQVPIPATFLKHAQSKSLVENHPKKDTTVTKDQGGLHTETLLHRNRAYRAQRSAGQHVTSIEGFRMQEIKRAGDFLAANRVRAKP
ncbi:MULTISPECIES: type III secretion system YopJ family effector HopZ3 [Pseudomonas]|nr:MULTISPECIES: type III secretion system YopJ family effector HopZ3 [Pseudomonas]KTB75355.1 avirulence protein [Pseudomonas sp. ICMP 3272]KTC55248.1 avirulence protein [Pseudomonas syringae ICMP 19498]KTC62165.1 avirulence protein [Pseudomonas savastanoi]MDU8543059.1 type III secretion system YopJ family effector HopZ3 [Pseudomonas syringae group sp. J248-6]